MGHARDLTGKTFGRLTVLDRVKDGKSNTRWLCQCECGNTTTAVSGNLTRGRHKSCGCYRGGPTNHKHKPIIFQSGYVFVKAPNHPRAGKRTGRVREHILVMEKIIGRHLLPDEEVHHKNGIRSDNRKENLELWKRSQPAGSRVTDLVKWAKEILKMYPMIQ